MTEDTAPQTIPTSYPTGEDLSRLREIAEEGRRSPLVGGRHLIVWGSIIALAALTNWAIVARVLEWPGYALAIVWFGLLGIGWIASTVLGSREARKNPAMTTGNRVERTVWITLGAFLSSLALSLFVYTLLGEAGEATERAKLFAMMAPVGFGAYAMALNASAIAGDEPRLKPFVVISLALAVMSVLLLEQPTQLLVMAAGLIVVSVIPGFMLVRAENARD